MSQFQGHAIDQPGSARGKLAAGALLIFFAGALLILAQMAGPHLAHNWYAVPHDSRGSVLPVGSLVYVQYVDAHDLRVGDVVVYQRPEEPDVLLFHRVGELRQAPAFRATGVLATMQGSNEDDPPFIIQFAGDVQRVAWYTPHFGSALLALRQVRGDLLFVLFALALNLSWMWYLARRFRSGRARAANLSAGLRPPLPHRSTFV